MVVEPQPGQPRQSAAAAAFEEKASIKLLR